MAYVDLDLQKNDDGYYDISFNSSGDFSKTKGFNTAIKMSLFCEKRASESEVPLPEFRRGWYGNAYLGFDNFELGSKLWLLFQARATQFALNKSVTYATDAFQWMTDNNYLDKVDVTSEFVHDKLQINVDLLRSNNVISSFGYSIWDNTLIENNTGTEL
jgi:phage gp46-like protein